MVNDESIKTLTVLTGRASMPAQARKRLQDFGATLIPASEIARKAGTTKCGSSGSTFSFPAFLG